jgi:putative ABC transport system substrate-binding protein
MRRRELLIGSGAAVLVVPARQGSVLAQMMRPAVAVLRVSKAEGGATLNRVLRRALTELGHEDGRTLRLVEYFEDHVERLPGIATEIVDARPNAIVALGLPAVRAVQAATTSIPIIAVTSFAIELGLVPTLARPGGNLSGVTIFSEELNVKRLALLRELLPQARRFVALRDPAAAPEEHLRSVRQAAQELRVTFDVVDASRPEDIIPALRKAREAGFEAVNVLASPMFNGVSGVVAAAAAETGLPSICQWREMTEAGCLMSYGPSYLETLRVVAKQLDRVLGGARVADLPFEQPAKFELVVNLKTAGVLGITVPPLLLARADEVIE